MNMKLLVAATPLGTALRYTAIVLVIVVLIELALLFTVGGLQGGEHKTLVANFDLPQPRAMAPQSTYNETVERSLFSLERKPKEAVQTSGAVAKGNVSEAWLLAGVVKSGDQSYALFSEKQGQRHLKLEVGMLLDQWKIESISANQVGLSRNGETETLDLLLSVATKKTKRTQRKSIRPSARARANGASKSRTAPRIPGAASANLTR